jgi:hypothetical protein
LYLLADFDLYFSVRLRIFSHLSLLHANRLRNRSRPDRPRARTAPARVSPH